MAVTNTTVAAADLQTYFADRLLVTADKDSVFKGLGMQQPIPSGSSKTISFTQYTKLAQTSAVLTEGVTPTDTALATTAITATVDQIGAYVTLTDLVELTVKHPIVQETIALLADQAVESIDSIILTVLLAGTQVQYANGRASRATVTATDVMTTAEFRKAIKLLRTNGARPFTNSSASSVTGAGADWASGNYVMVVDPAVEQDILADTTFVQASQYSQVQRLNASAVGVWGGIEVRRSNNIPTIASTTTVHTSFLFGKGAFAVSELQSLQTFIEGPGSNSDPLNQRKTIGWKTSFKSVILNQTFMLRIESGSNY
jgi:N4-gp56 family major capsid protein